MSQRLVPYARPGAGFLPTTVACVIRVLTATQPFDAGDSGNGEFKFWGADVQGGKKWFGLVLASTSWKGVGGEGAASHPQMLVRFSAMIAS